MDSTTYNPLSDAERFRQVRGLIEPALGAGRSQALIAAVEGLDGLPELSEFVALLAPSEID